jgi:superfamily II DNA/RNA helicase
MPRNASMSGNAASSRKASKPARASNPRNAARSRDNAQDRAHDRAHDRSHRSGRSDRATRYDSTKPDRSQRRDRPREYRRTRRTTSAPAATPPDVVRERELDAALDAAARVEPADLPHDFGAAGLSPRLASVLQRRGIRTPFPIQARTLPDGLEGRDVLGRAQTGSGKTLAFGLPMISRLAGGRDTTQPGHPRGLVLVPTRELAQQVADALAPLARELAMELTTIYGGSSMRRQVEALRRGVDIVVATPGRLIDLIEQGECALDQIETCVLDEADYMADLGFLPAVTTILDLTPDGGQRMLFSATLDRGVSRLVSRYLSDPAFHAVAPAAAPIDSVDHQVFTLQPEDKVAVAAEIAGRPGRTLFFVRTKYGADRLARQLTRSGVDAAAIHGDLKQGARRRALAGFANGAPRVLIATDVAARGIHVDDVDLVVHFDPSADHKDYLHRSGRTARAGATGTVVSLVHPEQRRDVDRLHQQAKVSATAVEVEPGHSAVRAVATSGSPVVVRTPEPRDRRRPGRPRSGGSGSAPSSRHERRSRKQGSDGSKRRWRPARSGGDRTWKEPRRQAS